MLLQGAVNEAIVRAGTLEEGALAHGLEEGDKTQGEKVVEREEEAENVVFDDGLFAES